MVFHSIDNMSSLSIHILAPLACYNIRWYTLPYEATLPAEQRTFLDLDPTFNFYQFLAVPICLYFLWMTVYFSINFVLRAAAIKANQFDTMYKLQRKKKAMARLFDTFGEKLGPVVFCLVHFCFFVLNTLVGIVCFYSEAFNVVFITCMIGISVYNSSCFYMDYFSKKYEASLQKLE